MERIEWLTYGHFATRAGEPFEVQTGETTLSAVLVEASESTEPGGPGPRGQERRQFSLLFRGPLTPVLPQATYRLVHADLGELDLFLVPVASVSEGVLYEAAFA